MNPYLYLISVLGLTIAAGFLGHSHADVESLQPYKRTLALAAILGVWASFILTLFVFNAFTVVFQVATIAFWAWTIGLRIKTQPPKQ